ncbi:hypothetical protein BGZ58_002664 [Dissophora ornata]|nr:hypothetical protein BGZ58_002664 [Dissophora ornata]
MKSTASRMDAEMSMKREKVELMAQLTAEQINLKAKVGQDEKTARDETMKLASDKIDLQAKIARDKLAFEREKFEQGPRSRNGGATT